MIHEFYQYRYLCGVVSFDISNVLILVLLLLFIFSANIGYVAVRIHVSAQGAADISAHAVHFHQMLDTVHAVGVAASVKNSPLCSDFFLADVAFLLDA